jgi:hypothetical protein
MADRDESLRVADDTRPRGDGWLVRSGTPAGFVLGLLGATLYLIGVVVLPYASGSVTGGGPRTLLSQLLYSFSEARGASLAEILGLLWVAIVTLVICFMGLKDRRPAWSFALLGASSVWFVHHLLSEVVRSSTVPIELGWPGARAIDVGILLAFGGGVIGTAGIVARRRSATTDDYDGSVAVSDDPRGSGTLGFYVALGGALLYAIGAFLPYARIPIDVFMRLGIEHPPASALEARTLAHIAFVGGFWRALEGVFRYYGPTIIVMVTAAAGLLARNRRPWAAALLGAAIAWAAALTTVATRSDRAFLSGFWVTEFAIIVAVGGGILAVRATSGTMSVRDMARAVAAPVSGSSG